MMVQKLSASLHNEVLQIYSVLFYLFCVFFSPLSHCRSVLGMTRYDADQDDLLVNMEDVGRLDTNFRNPTYSQLTVY